MVAGDFNTSFSMRDTDKRGELFADLELAVLNVGVVPTFDNGNRSSRIDVTLASTSSASGSAHNKLESVCILKIPLVGTGTQSMKLCHGQPARLPCSVRPKDIGIVLRHIKSNIQSGSLNA